MEGQELNPPEETRTAHWTVAQLRELHPVFFAHLQAMHNAPPSVEVFEADEVDDDIEISTGQAMSL